MARKEQPKVSSDLEDFNSGSAAASEGSSGFGIFKAVVQIKKFEMRSDEKDGKKREFIFIEFEGLDNNNEAFTAFKRQYLNRNDEGKLKNWMYEGGVMKDGKTILPSIAWELKDLAKEHMGEAEYTEMKKTLGDGKLTKPVFEAMEVEMEFKRITSKDSGEEFIIPMFAYDRQKDEEYKRDHPRDEEVDPEEADKGIKELENKKEEEDNTTPENESEAIDPEDLPF